ncbi:MAG: HD domain-containing protein, partial [Gemmatimonadaceae bacterium]|nr:HD domain-containing protein [Gemmatimonadaceae bacterium]
MDQIVAFILEVDRLKGVTRQTRPLGLDRYENSAEHSWQIALLAASLEAHAAEPVDIARVIRMLLVHDVGEIDAGDTFLFVDGGWAERKAAERAGAERVFALLDAPRAAEFLALWQEFEDGISAESRFANAVDRAMPALLNLTDRGQSWRAHGVSYERVVARLRPQIEGGCPALWQYLAARLAAERDA